MSRHGGGSFQNLRLRHAQLVFHVEGAGGDEEMDPGIGGMLHSVPGGVDVQHVCPGQRGDGAVLHRGGDGAYALKIAGGGDGKAGFDHIDLQLLQTLRDLDLLSQVHGAAGGLLAVTEGGVKYYDVVHGAWFLSGEWYSLLLNKKTAQSEKSDCTVIVR